MIKVGKKIRIGQLSRISLEASKNEGCLKALKLIKIKVPKNTLKVLNNKISFGYNGDDFMRNMITMKHEATVVLFKRK